MMESIRIDGGILISMNATRQIFPRGGVYIEGNTLHDIGPTDDLKHRYPTADHIVDATGHIILPGLISSHCHCIASWRRFLDVDLPLLDWLQTSKWPFHSRITPKVATQGTRVGVLENLRFGVTSIIDNYYPPRTHKENAEKVMEAAEILLERPFV